MLSRLMLEGLENNYTKVYVCFCSMSPGWRPLGILFVKKNVLAVLHCIILEGCTNTGIM